MGCSNMDFSSGWFTTCDSWDAPVHPSLFTDLSQFIVRGFAAFLCSEEVIGFFLAEKKTHPT